MAKVSITSKLAHESSKQFADKHKDIIVETLSKMRNGMGTATDIAVACKLDYHAVNRRLSELVTNKSIEIFSKTGGVTRTGSPCRIYRAIPDKNIAFDPPLSLEDLKQGELFAA